MTHSKKVPRMVAALSGLGIAQIVQDAIRRLVAKPQVEGPVAIWEGGPARTSVNHDSVHDQP